ncbi:MAG: hypothetical protein N5P05_002043 [Chroococcopsis gigantea SAG 12.99]|jgi:hypothetical protein|nr:DUF2092 domain-containing protein [Chlorogloea purpurea SAG 13.99]MDV3000437.1 hypothetical protein [Chroococcopsis gigantea SAG 12.99]
MTFLKKYFLLWLFYLSFIGTPPVLAQRSETKSPAQEKLEPQALAILRAMSDRLSAANSMSFTAITSYESPSLLGPPLVYTTVSEVTFQRPNKLRVITPGDGQANEFYYDGKTMSAYLPKENLIAVASAPDDLDIALKMAYDSAAIYFPFTDVIVKDPYKDIVDGLKVAFVMGRSQVIGGTTTDIIVLANDKIFAQVWIGAEDKLPRMIRAVYRDDPSRLRHLVVFENWKLNIPVQSDSFNLPADNKALPIPFARPEPTTSTPKKP